MRHRGESGMRHRGVSDTGLSVHRMGGMIAALWVRYTSGTCRTTSKPTRLHMHMPLPQD